MLFSGKRGFTLMETLIVAVFTAGLLLLVHKVFTIASGTSVKSEANDSAVFISSSIVSEEMSRTLRFTSSNLIKVFRYSLGAEDKRLDSAKDVAILAFPSRGWYDLEARGVTKMKGFKSPEDLGYYVQFGDVDYKSFDPSGELEWSSYTIYFYYYDKSAEGAEDRVLNGLPLSSSQFDHRSLYEIRFLLKNSLDKSFSSDTADGSEFVYFMQKKTSVDTLANNCEKGTSGGSTIIGSNEDLKNFLSTIEEAASKKSKILSFRKLASKVEHFRVSMAEYPLVDVSMTLDYGKGGSAQRVGGMSGSRIEKELSDFSFQILPAMR